MASFPLPPSETERLNEAQTAVRAGQRVEMTGLWGSSASLILSHFIRMQGTLVAVAAADEREALSLKEDLEFFLERTVPYYPAAEPESLSEKERRAVLSERLSLIAALESQKPPPCFVLCASSLLAPIPRREDILREALFFEPGQILDLSRMEQTLLAAGFRPTPMVTAPAEFSLRGDIVDIYPMAFDHPVRIELFDEEIESLREIDLESQRSVARLERITIPLPLIGTEDALTHLPALLPRDLPLVIVEPHAVQDHLTAVAHEVGSSEALEKARSWLEGTPGVDLLRIAQSSDEAIRFQVLPAQGKGRMMEDLKASVDHLLTTCSSVRVLCQNHAEARRLEEVLREQGIHLSEQLNIQIGRLTEGFQFPALDVTYINHHELFLRLPVRRQKKRRRIRARALESYSELEIGDLVVHLVHGIARFDGTTRMERDGGQEDFLMLTFDRDTLLYVPASKVHLVEKYIGGGGAEPPLDRLGGKSFTRRKEKVEAALRDLAADLLDLQAAREEERGCAFGPDDELQDLFDASFPYEDTDDQVQAVQEIKDDMERKKPMDRLLCGDVGFGKTELAIRAAFKAVNFGKQVAVLVPTTILAQQHFETFRARLADYPVNVEVLSRFRSRAQQKTVTEAARRGQVDILIGTHRLLSKDVGFMDLGLLVIDEEQRFGVMHKERLKRLKRTVDVLTMTATPIPRTLHMALVGIRDISNLETAPEGRMSIHTRVIYKDWALIKQALHTEVLRGGQAFYVHNRVQTIARETERIKRLLPEARIAFAHGQMSERELERIMLRFIQGKIDVLVCTTIIESGIDLPAVNTILIDRADTFGLADLHQLRGRVGRGHVRANALLMIPKGPLPDVALRRLQAIEELSQLGAGFRIALKDLEIRGAGNILGAEQHGHIAAVGYELYCRLLKRTILGMKGQPQVERHEEVDLDLRVDAFLPQDYIAEESQRMEILRKLGRIHEPEGLTGLRDELEDRFGRLPRPLESLLDLCLVRILLGRCGIKRAATPAGSRHLVLELSDEGRYARLEPFKPREMRFLNPGKAHLHPPHRARTPGQVLKFLKSRLQAVTANL